MHVEYVRIIQAKHLLALGEGDASVQGVTPSFGTQLYRGRRVISIGLCVAFFVPPVHLREAWDRLNHRSVEMSFFPALLLCHICKGTHAIGRALPNLLDIGMRNASVCEFYVELLVVPMITNVQSRRETDVHMPMVIMGSPRRIFMYLYGAKPFHDLFSAVP
jgi:hypothetical protein